jgi:hypothetical protein
MAVLFLKVQKALTNLLSELGGLWTAGRPLGNNPHERIVAKPWIESERIGLKVTGEHCAFSVKLTWTRLTGSNHEQKLQESHCASRSTRFPFVSS